MASTAWRKDTKKKREAAERHFDDAPGDRAARKRRAQQRKLFKEKRREHMHESYKAYSKHLDASCQDVCDNYVQRAINATEFGKHALGEKYFDLYERCKRNCYDARLGKRYRKKRGWEVTGKKTHRKPPTGRVGALRGIMKTGTKVMLGVGALAVAGIGYYLWSRGKQVVDPDYGYTTDSVMPDKIALRRASVAKPNISLTMATIVPQEKKMSTEDWKDPSWYLNQ